MEPAVVEISNNALTAKNGFKAEKVFRTQVIIRVALEQFFGKRIVRMEAIHKKKYDTIIHFEDGTNTKIQNKKIQDLDGRGDSFDRRDIENTIDDPLILSGMRELILTRRDQLTLEEKKTLENNCNGNKKEIENYLKKTLCGPDNEENDYFCIMKTDGTFTNMEIYMISTQKLFDYLKKNIAIRVCNTCLHLSKNIYLQRKGGGSKDKAPDDIQAKFTINQDIINLCDKVTTILTIKLPKH